jgi:tetratricopeptide (TPR) repeat protein
LNQTGKVNESIAHYQIAIASNPVYPFPFADLALIKINQTHFDEAIDLLHQALSLSKTEDLRNLRSTIYYGLSAAYANKGEFSKASVMIRSSLEANPLNQDAIALEQKIKSVE